MSSSTINDCSERTDIKDQRLKNSKTLPSKIYKPRNSPLTDLFAENKHFKSAYNLVMAMFLGTVISVAATEYANEGRVYLGFRTVHGAFRNFRYAFLIWPFLFLSTLAAYYSFTVWAKIHIQLRNANKTYIKYEFINLNLKKIWDILSLSLFVLYYPSLFYFSFKAVIIYDLGIAASFAVLMETTRCLMKVHAFVRSNCPKYTQKTNGTLHPTFNHYIYFLFSPALVYKDYYPRCNDPIKWKLAAVQVLEMVLAVIFFSVIYEKKFLLQLNDYGIRTYTWINILTFILEHFYEGLLLFLLFFYSGLHTYLNITSEVLGFSDRLFYEDWWTSNTVEEYLRKWNIFIYDWLYTYVYKDFYENVVPNKFLSRLAVLIIVHLVHDYIFCISFRVFIPISCMLYLSLSPIITIQNKHDNNPIFKVVFWLGFGIAISTKVTILTMEYFARINCPLKEETFYNYIMPRMLYC